MTQWSKAASVLILANSFQEYKGITEFMKCYTHGKKLCPSIFITVIESTIEIVWLISKVQIVMEINWKTMRIVDKKIK